MSSDAVDSNRWKVGGVNTGRALGFGVGVIEVEGVADSDGEDVR